MLKKLIFLVLAVSMLFLVSCSSANEYGLSYSSDGSDKVEYIYYNDDRVVYVVGGIMTAEIDGSAKMLELALHDGNITIDDILGAAEEDVTDGDIEATDYPDGSREYHYGSFDIIKLNTHLGCRDVYFVPSGMSYYDVVK